MSGFLHYFFSALDPTSNLGFSRGLIEVASTPLPSWWLWAILPFVVVVLPLGICWVAWALNPAWVRPPPPPHHGQRSYPLVSLVIAGRNESATIGECIRGALLCGYPNIEVVFVDDNSEDDSVAIARRAALSVTTSRQDADRVRIFPSRRRNGKASSLNIGIRMARGEFIAVTDADSVIQYGSVQHWLLPFSDPQVGAVAANCRVNNGAVNLLTRLQEIEYALKFTMGRYTLSRVNLLNIVSGMGGLFRSEIFRRLGGYDTGLGDDTDMTTNIRKQRWKVACSLDAIVWTTVPETRDHLWKQRMRWRRNMVKIRVSKHRDQFILGRYGFANAVLAVQLLLGRILLPATALLVLLWVAFAEGPIYEPQLLLATYWVWLIFLFVRTLISREIASTPTPYNYALIFIYPFYVLWLMLPCLYAEWAELLRIGSKHPYVPDHVWDEAPWW